jgi:hypothetical protein
MWKLNGLLHRTDGPAVISHLSHGKYWYLYGVELPEEEHAKLCGFQRFDMLLILFHDFPEERPFLVDAMKHIDPKISKNLQAIYEMD